MLLLKLPVWILPASWGIMDGLRARVRHFGTWYDPPTCLLIQPCSFAICQSYYLYLFLPAMQLSLFLGGSSIWQGFDTLTYSWWPLWRCSWSKTPPHPTLAAALSSAVSSKRTWSFFQLEKFNAKIFQNQTFKIRQLNKVWVKCKLRNHC